MCLTIIWTDEAILKCYIWVHKNGNVDSRFGRDGCVGVTKVIVNVFFSV